MDIETALHMNDGPPKKEYNGAVKFFIGVSQVILFVVSYELLCYVLGYGMIYVLDFLSNIKGIAWFLDNGMIETSMYTTFPFIVGVLIVFLFAIVYKKARMYMGSWLAIFAILAYTHITRLVSSVNANGLISWDTANYAWQSVIMCGVIMCGLYRLMIEKEK